MQRFLPLLAIVGGWWLAVLSHPRAVDAPPTHILTGPSAFLLSGGHPTAAATGIWSTTVVHTAVQPPGTVELVMAGSRASHAMDPTFGTPLAYGARMVLSAGDLPSSLGLLERGHAAFPDDPWYPWLIGMQLWLEGGRPAEAVPWLERADELDATGDLHGRAAAAAAREAQ